MSKMTQKEIEEHNKNPNIFLKVSGSVFYCKVKNCGCNLFHHIDDWDEYFCNGCNTKYKAVK